MLEVLCHIRAMNFFPRNVSSSNNGVNYISALDCFTKGIMMSTFQHLDRSENHCAGCSSILTAVFAESLRCSEITGGMEGTKVGCSYTAQG